VCVCVCVCVCVYVCMCVCVCIYIYIYMITHISSITRNACSGTSTFVFAGSNITNIPFRGANFISNSQDIPCLFTA